MKRKILLIVAMVAALVCILALSVSAATTPDASKGTVTLSDGTVCPLYDTNGNALIWYISTNNTDDGYEKYDFIRADSGNGEEGYEGGTVYFKATYQFGANTNSNFESTNYSITLYEVSELRIVDKNGQSIDKGNIVVFNGKDVDIKVNDASNSSYLGKPVNCIKNVFWANKKIEYLYLGTEIVALQANAINGCDNLKYVNLEELVNLRQLGGGSSLANNPKLFLGGTCNLGNTSILTIDGSGAMANNAYSELIFPETLVTIGNYPFEKNPNITRVEFNSALKNISGINHFYNCFKLETVDGFGDVQLTGIPEGMFGNCYALSSIEFPDTLQSIGKDAFISTSLTEVVIPNRVEKIGQNAFKYCEELTTVTIGSGVTTFGGYDVFNSCPKLTTIYMSAGITGPDLRNTFYGSDALTTVYFVGTLSELNAFCDALSAVSDNTNFTDLTKISVDAYEALTDKTGSYVIYDYSACVVYNNGIHEEIGEGGNACYLAECKNCSFKNKYIGNDDTHRLNSQYVYANGYMAAGQIVSVCQNAGCKHGVDGTAITSPLDALFNSLEYSVAEEGFGICVKYNVNRAALAAYKNSGKSISFGVVAVMADMVENNGPLANDGKLTTEKNVVAADVTADNLRAVTLRIAGDENAWKDNASRAIYVLGYATNGTDLEYLGTASGAQVDRNNITSVKSLVIGNFFNFNA